MHSALELLIGLLNPDALSLVDWDDLQGRFGQFLQACQVAGFVSLQPCSHPVPSCPRCCEGVPYRLGGRLVCNCCHSAVDPRYLRCWRFDITSFLRWLAGQLHLRGDVRPVDDCCWQLGSHEDRDGLSECFFVQGEAISDKARGRLAAYRNSVVLYGLHRPREVEGLSVTLVSLLGMLGLEQSLSAGPLRPLDRSGVIRFQPRSGRLEAAGSCLGEVPPGCREHAFLDCLWHRQGEFVAYGDIKRAVLRVTGGEDSRDEASFCHRLKSRIKKKYVRHIDALISTSNKSDGYRLRVSAADSFRGDWTAAEPARKD